MKAIEVGGDVLELPTDIFDTGDRTGTIIDSGTTLAYLPDTVYDPLVTKVPDVLVTSNHLKFVPYIILFFFFFFLFE